MMKKKVVKIMLVAVMTLILGGCGGEKSDASDSSPAAGETQEADEKTKVTIGLRADGVDRMEVVRDRIEALGYELEIVSFDDSIQPNVALTEGSVDMNWFQHGPYLDAYNEENGTDLVMIDPKTHYPLFAMYSEKHSTVEELPDGAVIGLCNDATNQERGLRLLESQGLITLDETVEVPTMYDVKDNPHNFEFIEAEMSVLPQSLSDVDAICLAAAHMVNAGKSSSGYLCESTDGLDYALGFVVRAEDAQAEWAKEIAEAVQCDEVAEYFKTEQEGTLIPLWE